VYSSVDICQGFERPPAVHHTGGSTAKWRCSWPAGRPVLHAELHSTPSLWSARVYDMPPASRCAEGRVVTLYYSPLPAGRTKVTSWLGHDDDMMNAVE
jgi:hypothetical protein